MADVDPNSIQFRKFGDHSATREAVFANALEAVRKLPPAENARYRLTIEQPHYAKDDKYSIADHKRAILEGRSLSRRLIGTYVLTDKATGQVVDKRSMTVAAIPWLTSHGTFLQDGTGLPVSHQLRLLPGIFTRRTQSGTVSSHVNIHPGTGVTHHITLDPASGVFKTRIGQAELPTLPLLRALGVPDDRIKQTWGDVLFSRNAKAEKPHHLERYWEKFKPPGPVPDGIDYRQALKDRLTQYPLDPWVMKRTTGVETDRYGGEPLLAATGKILDVVKGKAEPDARDHPAFSMVLGPEHTLPERITKSGGPYMAKALWAATNTGNLKRVVPGLLSPAVRSLFTKSGLALTAEGTSAAEYVDHGSRITKVGEGGIGRSSDSVPLSSRDYHIGQYPFIDPIKTSECHDSETEVLTISGWKKWPDVTADDRFACRIHDELRFEKAECLQVFDYDGVMYGARTRHVEYLVTPNHRLEVRLASYVDAPYFMTTAEEIHGRFVHHRIAGHDPWPGDKFNPVFTLPDVRAAEACVDDDESDDSSRRRLGDLRLSRSIKEFPIDAFSEFMGWFLGEGSVCIRTGRGRDNSYSVSISQSWSKNQAKCIRIQKCLRELGFSGSYSKSNRSFSISNKRLAMYLKQFGYSGERWIPEEFLTAPVSARRRLFEALLLGEATKGRGRTASLGYGAFSSTSRRLAEDFSRLAFSLGYSTSISTYTDNRKPTYLMMNIVTIHSRDNRIIRDDNQCRRKLKPPEYYTKQYSGKVYCATVPGGMLYTRRNGMDGIWSGNSTSVGVDLRTAFGTRLGSDNRIYAPLIDRRTNRLVFRNPQHLFDSVLALPGAMHGRNPVVEVVKGGRLTYAPRHEVDYIAPAMEQTFSPLTNMVPLKSASKAHRPSMGSRYIAQSLPLEQAEAPLVRTQVPGQPGKSFEELYGRHMGPVHADADAGGVVTEVTPDHIAVRYANGTTKKHELYRAFPSGRMTSLQSYPLVKPGDSIQPGQMLARSNYTDEKGHAAYGRNLRVGFMLGQGEHSVYEDSIAISQSAAEKLKSHHMYQHNVEPGDDVMIGKHAHTAAFGGKHTLDTLKTVGDDGLVKPGTVVKYGDPLIMAVRRKVGEFGRLSRSGRAALSDASETWEHHEPGVVEDAIQTPNGPIVTVSTYKPAVDADKVSSWHGNKGVVRVVPDHKMPIGEDGRPLEMIFSSLGTVSRANPSAIFASILGKVAEKTGKPYVLSDFDDQADGRNIGAWVAGEARRHGVKFKETLTDPETGRKIPGVGVGTMYVMKLLHMAEKKQKGRGLGAYDETGQPLRGQSGKAMRSSLGDTNALLGYGATSVIHDDHIYKGAANEEFWARFMQGYPVAKPDLSPAFDRFLTELQAAGADPVRKDGRLQLMPLTSKRIHEMAGDRVVRNAETLDFSKNGEPYPGGLFDPSITGSPDSSKTWAKILLHEPMVNPAAEDGARRLLGLTEKNFRETIAGRHSIATGTGPSAIAKALESMDVQTELKKVRELAKSSRKTTRDEANRRLFYLKGLERTGLQPKDWVVDAVPVLPPLFRPVRPGGPRGEAITADANLLYSDLINANSSLKELSSVTKDVGDEHLNLYDAMKAVIGLGDPVGAKNRERGVTGVLGRLLGSSAKYGYAQQKLLGTTINLSGRGTILPNPDLDMDQAGIPEPVAWEIFHPFIVRRMIRSGMSRVEAAKAIEDRSKIAKDHLLAEMEVRPVRLTRYPALHRFSTMGFRPVLAPGNAIQTNHIITKPYNADFDGNCLVYCTEVWIEFDPCLCYQSIQEPGPVGRSEVEDWYVKIVENESVYLHDGRAYCRVRIGDMPRFGTPTKDRNGADVYPLPDGFSVLTYDHTASSVRYAKITHLTVENASPCSEVKTRHGCSFTVSDNESVCVFDSATGGLVKVRPADSIGRFIPRVKVVPSFGVDGTFESGWWYGVLVADGWVGDRTVGYSKLDDRRRSRFAEIATSLFGSDSFSLREYRESADSAGSRFGDSAKIHLNGSIAKSVFNIYAMDDGAGRSALRKKLPSELLDLGSRSTLLGLFSGLLDGDAVVSWNHHSKNKRLVCRFNTSSPYLRDDILQLGLRLGVRMSVTTSPATKKRAESYTISPSLVDLHKIAAELRLVSSTAADAMEEFRSSPPPRDQHDPIPINSELALALRKAVYPDDMSMYVIAGKAAADGCISRMSARKFLELDVDHPQADVFRKMVENETVTWERVISADRAGDEQVFDLAVPDTKVFVIGNGLVVYDTMTVSVPLSDAAVAETYDKMLPSRNLYSPASVGKLTFVPGGEDVPGFYAASTGDAGNPPLAFPSRKAAVNAYKSNDPSINYNTRVVVNDEM